MSISVFRPLLFLKMCLDLDILREGEMAFLSHCLFYYRLRSGERPIEQEFVEGDSNPMDKV